MLAVVGIPYGCRVSWGLPCGQMWVKSGFRPRGLPRRPAVLYSRALGDVAQLGEHRLCKPGVEGSSPFVSTRYLSGPALCGLRAYRGGRSAAPARALCACATGASRRRGGTLRHTKRRSTGASAGRSPMASSMKRLLLGNPLHNREAAHQRLSNPVALAVFSSDALSSVAYATQEILLVLALAGTAYLQLTLPIAVAIGVLLVVVVLSYRQTIKEYPGGGGAYIVAKENLGTIPGLIAGASLLVDYILTVAVSISASVAAITSALPATAPYRVPMAVFFVLLLAVANLRGVKESGALFAGPTFVFVGSSGFTVVVGSVALHKRPAVRPFRRRPSRRGDAGAHALPGAQGVRVRMHGDDRRRGDRQRRPGVQAARGQERRQNAPVDGRHPALPVPRTVAASRCSRGVQPGEYRDGDQPDHARHVRHRVALLRDLGERRRDPGAGGEHRVRGLPAARLVHGRRRLPAAPAQGPRLPAGVQQRNRAADAGGDRYCSSSSAA